MIQQNTPEWLEMRRTHIGASDAPIILGISPWKTSLELWEEKVLGKETEATQAMNRGHALEEQARACFESMTGIVTMPKVLTNPELHWQMASLDGITMDETTIVEIKCPGKATHELAKKGVVPDHYMAQLQHQICVSKASKAYYFSFDGENGVVVEVMADHKLIAKIVKEEEKFLKYLLTKESPPISEKDYVQRDDADWVTLAREYKEVKDELDILKQCEEGLREKLIAAASNRNTYGAGLKLTRSVAKGLVDYKMVPELIGVDLEPYRKPPCEKWRISIESDTD